MVPLSVAISPGRHLIYALRSLTIIIAHLSFSLPLSPLSLAISLSCLLYIFALRLSNMFFGHVKSLAAAAPTRETPASLVGSLICNLLSGGGYEIRIQIPIPIQIQIEIECGCRRRRRVRARVTKINVDAFSITTLAAYKFGVKRNRRNLRRPKRRQPRRRRRRPRLEPKRSLSRA